MGGDPTDHEDEEGRRSPTSPSSPRTTTSGSTPVVSPERRRVPGVDGEAEAEADGGGGNGGPRDQGHAVVRGGGSVVAQRKLDAYIPAAGVVSIERALHMSGVSTSASDSIRYASAAATAAAAAAAPAAARGGHEKDDSTGGGGECDGNGGRRRRVVVPGRCGCTMLIHCGDYYASYPPPPVPPSFAVDCCGGDDDGGPPPPVDSSSGGTDATTTTTTTAAAAAATVVEDVDRSAATTTDGRSGNGHPTRPPSPPPPLVITVESVRDVVRSTLDAMHELAPTKGVPVAGGEDGQTPSSVRELISNGRDELLTSTGLYETTADGHLTFLRRMMLPMTIALQGCHPTPGGTTTTGGGVADGDDAKTDSQPNCASSTEEETTTTAKHHRPYHHCTLSVDFSLVDVLMGIDDTTVRLTVFESLVENLCRLGTKEKRKRRGEEDAAAPPPAVSSSSSPSNGDDDGGGEDEDASEARLEDEVRTLLLEHVRRLCREEEVLTGGRGKDGEAVMMIGDVVGGRDDDDDHLRDVARRCLSGAVHGEEVGEDLGEAVPELFRGVHRGRGGDGGGGGKGRKRQATNGGGRGGRNPKWRVKGTKKRKAKGKGKAGATRDGRRRAGGGATMGAETADGEATATTGGGADVAADADADGGPEDHEDHDEDGDDDTVSADEEEEDDDGDGDENVTEDEEENADDNPQPPVRVARRREGTVPSASGMASPPSPAGRRRKRPSSADAGGGDGDDDVRRPTLRRSSRNHVPKDRTPDGGMMIDSTTMSREEFEAKTAAMNEANAALRKIVEPGRSRPSLACLRSKLSPTSLSELIDVFFSRNGSLRREVRDDVDLSISNDPKYINFGNGDEHLGREDRRYQIGLRKHPVGGKIKTRERVEEIFVRDGVISPLHESLDDIGILVGGTEDQTLHHDVARQFVTWYETMPLTSVSAAEAEQAGAHLDGWEIDRVEYNDAMSSPHAPSSILIGLGDSGEVLLGVQKDQIARSSPTEKTCTIVGGCGSTYRIVRENEHVAVIVVPVGCTFTGDFPHCGVRNFQRGTPEDELLVRFNGVISSVVDGPSRSRVAKSKAVIEMLCNFPGLSGLSRLHCSTRMHVSDIMIPLNTIGYNDCWPNERDGRCYEEDEV